MGLPEKIRVKLSSEAAESISLTPVVVQEIPIRELIEHMLGVTGKDEPRIREILLRGSLVSGASRFRWAGWETELESIREILTSFPDPDPARKFQPASCFRAILRGGRRSIELPREAAMRKGLLQRTSFWDLLMEVITGADASYAGYSYRDRADRYLRELAHAEAERLRAFADAVQYSTLRDQVRTVTFTRAELYVAR